ncbi:MAG: chemotaxis protein CheX [Candidatus Hydrogenedentota bacterium]
MHPMKQTLVDVFSSTAEGFAFMFCEPFEGDTPPPVRGPCLQVQMSFEGPVAGTLTLAVPESLCPEIAANALGIELDGEEGACGMHDTIKELLNVTCGQFLTAYVGKEPVFDLSVPSVAPLGDADWAALCADPGTAVLVMEEEPVLLHATLRGDRES